jgi:hypothetical protein
MCPIKCKIQPYIADLLELEYVGCVNSRINAKLEISGASAFIYIVV